MKPRDASAAVGGTAAPAAALSVLASALMLAASPAPATATHGSGAPAVRAPDVAAAPDGPAPIARADTAPDPSPGFDVLAYRLRLSLWRGADTIRARQRVELMATRDGLERIRLHLDGLTVDSARVAVPPAPARRASDAARDADRPPARVDPRRSGDRLVLPVPGADGIRAGDTLAAEVFYRGAPADGLILRENLHGDWTVFADNWPNRARHWFPSVDHPADKARVAYRLEVPEGWSTVANGRRVLERPLDGGRRLVAWEMERPIPVYTMVVGAGPLAERHLGTVPAAGPDAPLAAVTFAEDVEAGRRLLEDAVGTTRRFVELLRPLPYPRLALVQAATRFGGMENAGAVFFPEGPFAEGEVAYRTVAHEIAHMWFGDDVTEARWGHLWLSEGFATWLAAVDAGERGGRRAYREEMRRLEEAYLGSDVVDRPVVADPDVPPMELLNENSYQKGAWVLHMLRAAVGDSAFFDGLRRYLDRHRAGTALTADLRRALEDASGRELAWFFDQWLRRPGHPDLSVRWRWEPAAGTDGGSPTGERAAAPPAGHLVLRVRQEQRWKPFRLELPVEARAGGRTVRRTVPVRGRETTVRIPLPARPERVTADPANRLLGPVETTRAAVEEAAGG